VLYVLYVLHVLYVLYFLHVLYVLYFLHVLYVLYVLHVLYLLYFLHVLYVLYVLHVLYVLRPQHARLVLITIQFSFPVLFAAHQLLAAIHLTPHTHQTVACSLLRCTMLAGSRPHRCDLARTAPQAGG
jgi:hypothetical protein